MDEITKPSQDPLGLSQEDLEALFQNTLERSLEIRGPEDAHLTSSQPENFKPMAESQRAKTSLRMKYEAEVQAIRKSHGGLEEIRRQLGLSKRKMSQLLMVDPSAWTRWTSQGGEAPPHIYRALDWFLLLQEKHPEYKSALWLNSVATPTLSQHEILNIKNQILREIRENFIETQDNDSKTNSTKLWFWLKTLILSHILLLLLGLLFFLF